MDYQCGNCGTPLDEAALDGGVCPTCGAKISPFGDVIEATQKQPIVTDPAASWPTASLEPPAEAPPITGPLYTNGPLTGTHTRLEAIRTSRATGRLADAPAGGDPLRRIPPAGLIIGISAALVLVLLCTIAVTGTVLRGLTTGNVAAVPTQTHKHTTPAPTKPIGLGFATQNPDPTPLPFTGVEPTLVPTTTPFGGPPTPTPKPSPSPSPTTLPVDTPTPGGTGTAAMDVQPRQATFHCPSTAHPFTILNNGGAPLTWNASSVPIDPLVTIQPFTDTVQPGQQETVNITNGTNNSIVVQFNDTSGASGPISVNIGCK